LISRCEEAMPSRVPKDEGKVSYEAFDAIFSPPMIGKRYQFLVRANLCLSLNLECRQQIRPIVEPAIQNKGIEARHVWRSGIGEAILGTCNQGSLPKGHTSVEPESPVAPAMVDWLEKRLQFASLHRRARSIVDDRESAHSCTASSRKLGIRALLTSCSSKNSLLDASPNATPSISTQA
jgi:hypothetical protein